MTQNQYLPENILIPFFGRNARIKIVEIGTLGASGSVAILSRMPNVFLYTIDPFKHFKGRGYEAENPQGYHNRNYEEAKKRLKEFNGKVQLLKMTSDEAIEQVNEKIDVVWVDGDHREAQVRRDIINWKKKLKPIAILGGHDWWLDHIKRVVYEELGKDIQTGEDGTWWKIFQ